MPVGKSLEYYGKSRYPSDSLWIISSTYQIQCDHVKDVSSLSIHRGALDPVGDALR